MAIGDLQNQNDTPIGGEYYRAPASGVPTEGSLLRWEVDRWVSHELVGCGGIKLVGTDAMADITAAWATIIDWTGGSLTAPVNVTQDVDNDGLMFDHDGVWQVTVKVTLGFTGVNNGRTIQLRVYDTTDMEEHLGPITFFAGRNQDGLNMNLTAFMEVPEDHLDHLFVLQVYGVDDFAGVSNLGSLFEAVHID